MKEIKQTYVGVDKKDKLYYYNGEKYIPVLDETGGGGDVQLKTINGQDLHGTGNLSITTYQAFPSSGPVDNQHTVAQFAEAITNDSNAVVGMAYRGGANGSDLPFEGNGDIVAEILQGPGNTKSIHIVLTSGNVEPFRGEYTYGNHHSDVGGVSGDYKTINHVLYDHYLELEYGNNDVDLGDYMSAYYSGMLPDGETSLTNIYINMPEARLNSICTYETTEIAENEFDIYLYTSCGVIIITVVNDDGAADASVNWSQFISLGDKMYRHSFSFTVPSESYDLNYTIKMLLPYKDKLFPDDSNIFNALTSLYEHVENICKTFLVKTLNDSSVLYEIIQFKVDNMGVLHCAGLSLANSEFTIQDMVIPLTEVSTESVSDIVTLVTAPDNE